MYLYKKLIQKLIKNNISISVVESCTGGLLSSKITNFSGVSKIYHSGFILYSNTAKSQVLGIPLKFINKYGAVSKQITNKILIKLYKQTKTNICICTTGIAGPTGGTKNKPVGLVFIGIKYQNKFFIIKKKYKGTRRQIQNKTIKDIFLKLNTLI